MNVLRWKGWKTAVWLAFAIAVAGCSASSGSTAGSSANEGAPMAAESKSEMAMDRATADTASSPEPMAEAPKDAAAGGSGFGTAPDRTANATGRMLIYKANLTMEVESYADTYTEIQNLIHLSGGYVVQFSEQTAGAERSGTFTLKVPAGDFNGFLKRIGELPHLSFNRSMNASDVSEEYVDLEARLKAKELVESRYLKYMEQAERAEDLIRYTNELGAIQENIEQLKGRMRYLEQNVAFSTVELRVYERTDGALLGAASEAGLGERMSKALAGSLNVLVTMLEGLMIVLAAAIPVVVVGSLLGAPIYWWIRRRKAKTEKN